MRSRWMWMAGAVLVVSLPGIALAGWDQTLKLKPNDGAAGDRFGRSLALSGNTVLVGSSFDDDNGPDSGSAYLFNATTGTQIAKFAPEDGAAGDQFGISVALSGNIALVGSWRDEDNGSESGSAYLFNTITGTQMAKLKPSDGAPGDAFGLAVAISGSTALVGSPLADHDGINSGSAYLFNTSTGAQLAKLTPSDGAANDMFGFAVAISGNNALISSVDISGTGSALLFNATTGAQIAKFIPDDVVPGDYFGFSVALHGKFAVIGSRRDDDNGTDSGSAYLFDITTGAQIAKFTPEDGDAGDYFGGSVALHRSTALIGSSRDGDNGTDSGSAYLFDITTGAQIAKLKPADGAAGDLFGSVALSGNVALVGSILDDDNGTDSGSAYLFAQDLLTPDPVSGGTITFTSVRPGVSITLDDIPSIANTGGPGSIIHVTGFSFTGPDAALFDLPGYTDVTLTAGAFDTIAYDLMFLGSDLIGDYSATLTLFTDSGDVTYTVSASVIPEPTTLALLAMMGWLSARRRG